MLLHSCPSDRLQSCTAHTAAPSAICESNAARHRCPVAFAPEYPALLHPDRPHATDSVVRPDRHEHFVEVPDVADTAPAIS